MPCPVRFGVGPFWSIFHAFRSYSENLISCWTQKMFSWNLFDHFNTESGLNCFFCCLSILPLIFEFVYLGIIDLPIIIIIVIIMIMVNVTVIM